ncbi:MAG: amino acid racemase [Calditrichaeota bacterium]|nr:MAG: amino acid racemase [Calditrichota bacterium]
MQHKTVGVLGGMGPESTAYFFQRLIHLTPAHCDQDHIPVVIYNNPRIPDRTDAILHQGASPVPELLRSISILEQAGADFICIPCNTVHYFIEEMREASSIPILDLIHLVAQRVRERLPQAKAVGLLATEGTIRTGLYQRVFSDGGVEVVTPEPAQFPELSRAIKALKDGRKESAATQALAEGVISRGAEAVVLGCTEFSLVADALSLPVPLFDSVEILAEEAVRLALEPAQAAD